MKIAIILLLSLLIKLYLADEEDYSFLKKFENGRLVSLDEGECPNLKNDPIVREMIAKRNKRKAMASSSPTALMSDKATTTKTAAVTADSTSAAMASKVPTSASSQTTIASSTAGTTTKDSTSTAMTSKVSTGASSQTTIASSTAGTTTKECFDKIIEVMFVVDGSGSIGVNNFKRVKDWLVGVVRDLIKIYGESVRTQVLQYSNKDRASLRLPIAQSKKFVIPYVLNDLLSAEEIERKIRDMRYLEGLTFTYYALRRAMEVEFPNSAFNEKSKKIVVVLTDGAANDVTDLKSWYNRYKSKVTPFAIGVGSYNLVELRRIANGDTSNDRVLTVTNFGQLQTVISELTVQIETITQTEGATTTSSKSSADDTGNRKLGSAIASDKNGNLYLGAVGMYRDSGIVMRFNSTSDESFADTSFKQIEEALPNRTESSYLVSCDITFNGICYWTHVEDEYNVNFTQAEEICSNNASTPAYFPSERVYNAMVEDLRSKIPSGWSWVYVWTGVTINTNTGNVIHPSGDTYVKWYPDLSYTGSGYETFTHVVLQVYSDPGSTNQGMGNNPPQYSYHGVVCQIVE